MADVNPHEPAEVARALQELRHVEDGPAAERARERFHQAALAWREVVRVRLQHSDLDPRVSVRPGSMCWENNYQRQAFEDSYRADMRERRLLLSCLALADELLASGVAADCPAHQELLAWYAAWCNPSISRLERYVRDYVLSPFCPAVRAKLDLLRGECSRRRRRIGMAVLCLAVCALAVWGLTRGVWPVVRQGYSIAKAQQLHGRGEALRAEKRYEDAIRCYDKSLALAPANADALHGRGCCYHELRDFARAIRDFDASLAIDGARSEAYFYRAFAHQELGHIDAAIADYSTTVQLAPTMAEL